MAPMTLDVVPVVAAPAHRGAFLIPDRKLTRWVLTHPKGHIEVAQKLNKESGHRFVPFVKIVKAWHCHHAVGERPKPKGFTLEALVRKYWDADAPSYGEGFVKFLERFDSARGGQLEVGQFPAVEDPGIPGTMISLNVSEEEAKRFGKTVRRSLKLGREALESEDLSESCGLWREVLGSCFPEASGTKALSQGLDAESESEEDAEVEELEIGNDTPLRRVRLSARLADRKHGDLRDRYPSDGRALPKGWWLRFRLEESDVSRPYMVRWIVKNHGREAQEAGDVMARVDSDGDSEVQWETTKYRGCHRMICELHRDGVVLGRAVHKVNIR